MYTMLMSYINCVYHVIATHLIYCQLRLSNHMHKIILEFVNHKIHYFYLFLFISESEVLQHLALEHQLSLAIWSPVRHQTIKLLEEHKDEVLKIVRDVRIAKIAGASTSLVVGGSLAIVGLILIPFTLGGSIGLTLVGAGVGAAGTATVLGSSIAFRIMINSRVKKAEEHINLDKQMSEHVNKIGGDYNKALKNSYIVTDCVHGAANIGGRVGVGVTRGITASIEAGVQAGSAAVRAGSVGLRAAAIAGGVVGGVALLVTVPLDIYQICKMAMSYMPLMVKMVKKRVMKLVNGIWNRLR